jgi:hypothetical protein
VDYSGEASKDKINSGLNSSLRRSWATVQNKLKNDAVNMGEVWEIPHHIEDEDRFGKRHLSHRTSNSAESSGAKKKTDGK